VGLEYFSNVRRDILPFLPAGAERVLEIGCGSGATLAHIKQQGLAAWVGGFEFDAEAAAVARPHVDWLTQGDVETTPIDLAPGSLDAIMCLDVLEHLRDPWALMPKLTPLLAPHGVLIASIPNVRNHVVVGNLLFRGKWDYQDEGLLDRTHLRFFTHASARELVEKGGLVVDAESDLGFSDRKRRKWRNKLAFGLLKDFYIDQFLFRARRP
jgi:2-polyprenyl-3-methyl-5-hydroxy-6-metoxy-1,4-benzoquinol methylase